MGATQYYLKLTKKLIIDNLYIAISKESPKYDGKGNGYQLVELKAKQRNRLFYKNVNLEVFVRVRFQWGEENRDRFHCPADEISLGLDVPRRLLTVAFGKVAKLAIAIKSRDFVLYSLRETDFCGEALEGDYTLTIVVYSSNIEFEPLELPCPVSIQEGDIVIKND